ncbi:MAG: diguanylate cyclase [Gammaproteobacteria bacterium]
MENAKENSQSKQALAALFTKRLPNKLKLLEETYQQLLVEQWPVNLLTPLKRQVQQLVSLAHASGLTDIESKLHTIQSLIEAPSLGNQSELERNLKALLESLQNLLAGPMVDVQHDKEERSHQIYLGMKNYPLATEIAEQLKYFGCYCHMFSSIDKILDEQYQPKAELILLDAELCQPDDMARLKAISEKIPIIFFSTSDSVKIRLFSLRAGGKAFFNYPFEFSTLIEKIDLLIASDATSIPYRVLIVEDSKTQANIIKQQLETGGMITQVLPHPLDINDVLLDFQPDVILMDLYMPECSGSELARIIRQQENFVSIPIVFLSAESDTKKQLDALSLGGDDFLTKPIETDHLNSSVKARAARSRALRAEMVQDSLTGLLNHTRVLEQLELEMARSGRDDTNLSFIMIDIDHFKGVNDKYGHPVGDRVIKSLARLLKKRLRKSDSVGRYGGEEFAVILPKTEAQIAQNIINEIRESFEKIEHQPNDNLKEFTCTFSAGIAHISKENNTVDALCQAADKALYAAKHSGRNCVVLESNFKQSN